MSETRQLVASFVVVILIGIAGYLASGYIQYSGDLVVDRYEAVF